MSLQTPTTFDGSFSVRLSEGDGTSRVITKDGDTILSQYQFFGDGSCAYIRGDGDIQLQLFGVDLDGNFTVYKNLLAERGIFSLGASVSGVTIEAISGTPEGGLDRSKGSLCIDKDTGILYIKTTDSGSSSGWVSLNPVI